MTLGGELFEKSGTMTGGGSKPRGGKMGTSIRATVSGEAVENAEKELSELVNEISSLRRRISDAVCRYQASEKSSEHSKMELAKCQKEVGKWLKSLYSFTDLWIISYSVLAVSKYLILLTFYSKQIESLSAQHDYIEKQLDSLKAASQPKREELDRLEELDKVIHLEEKELERLVEGSKKLKEKVHACKMTVL